MQTKTSLRLKGKQLCILSGNSEVAQLLLESGAKKIHATTKAEHPYICLQKVAEVVCLLLEAGADREKFDSEGKTALHRDSMLGNLELAQLLLATPVHWAAKFGRFEVVDLLLKQTDGGGGRGAAPELASHDVLGKSIECG